MTNILNKTIKKFGLPLLLAVGFTACGGGDASFTETSTVTVLTTGESIEVKPTDTITPLSEDTQITVEHIINTDNKTVTVKSGSLEYVAGNYSVN